MVEISAAMVKELRELTGLGMMECKKALSETSGDMKAAEDLLRVRSGAKASKAAGRVAAEGAVSAYVAADGKTGALVEVNCETDFVARNEDFIGFGKDLAKLIVESDPADLDALMAADNFWNNREQAQKLIDEANSLRKKIEPEPDDPRYISTEPWVGYRFNGSEPDL